MKKRKKRRNKVTLAQLTDVIALMRDEDFNDQEILAALLVTMIKEKKISMRGVVTQIDNLRRTAQKIEYLLDQEEHPLRA